MFQCRQYGRNLALICCPNTDSDYPQTLHEGFMWHWFTTRGLLRIMGDRRKNECNALLDSTRLTEKDGDPLCHRCYAKVRLPFLFLFYSLCVQCSCTAQQEVAILCSVRPVVRPHVCQRLGTSHCSMHDGFHFSLPCEWTLCIFLCCFIDFMNRCFLMRYYWCTNTFHCFRQCSLSYLLAHRLLSAHTVFIELPTAKLAVLP
ncbi:hypothetical protein EDD22DRAFT_350434 [Suillus occidentalis]|nr:hypothetical protein EDD22DRAFT_350434 [Suillus occidentalis]